ncbi:CshA/CshB family fibrillar adhesin-related protein, partial [Streptococcus sp. DD13]|uniref:CshA/CshB family fibrillar adhesin-related protein n=1 Tax=Streptococcus sp. DD13 TaxID=1777881 RepID=UPI0012E75B33
MGKELFNKRINRFSIRKLSVGTCSVLLGTLVMLGTAPTVAAEEATDNTTVLATTEAATSATEASAADTTATTSSTTEASSTEEAAPTTTADAATASTTETSAEDTPKVRTRRATTEEDATTAADTTTEDTTDASAATSTGVNADVTDATSTPKVSKPGFTDPILSSQLLEQVSWLDFGDTANWTGTTTDSKGNIALQVGAKYTKEVMPGYVVTITVNSLKPFQASDIYKKRMEEQGATAEELATYDPNAKNRYISGTITSSDTSKARNAGEEALVIAEAQNGWTEIRKEGINTQNKKTTISSEFDGGNIGVQFGITATYNGKDVKPAIVMADGESANAGELILFTTNGTGWEHIGEWKKDNSNSTLNYQPQNLSEVGNANLTSITLSNGATVPGGNNWKQLSNSTLEKDKVAWKYFQSPDQVTSGLGTGVFGPNISSGNYAVPIVMTKDASEVSLYIVSGGKQSAMLGFLPMDEGDAPESYGHAYHGINRKNGVTDKEVKQPYIGSERPDMDDKLTQDWEGDDTTGTGDEGIDQILPTDLKNKTNGMIKLDRTANGNYTLSIEAHTGGASAAYLYGWIDFNGDGKFDNATERSELATITSDGTVVLKFNNGPALNNTELNKLGVRVRISTHAPDIENPTGMSMSGEVEDFETQITFPPKGSKEETTGLQGVTQNATVAFTAYGKEKYSRTESAVIDTTVDPVIVDADGNPVTLDSDGYYVVAGEGKYKVTGNGTAVDVVFVPEAGFVGTAKGITIRRVDNNGYSTGWVTKDGSETPISDQTNMMDGRYIPTVIPMSDEETTVDLQGLEQTKDLTFKNGTGTVTPSADTPAEIVDPATGKSLGTSTPALKDGKEVGTYTIDPTTGKVTFTPNKDFVGTPDPIIVRIVDADGRTVAGVKYTPTVLPVTPVGEDKTTTGKQGQEQSETVTFKQQDGAETKVPMVVSADNPAKFIDPTTGEATDETTLPALKDGVQVGTYTIDPATGKVTFTPNKDFVGTPDGITVQAKDANGTAATATYTPTVTPVVPTATSAESVAPQGATQTGTVTFTEGDAV